MKIPTSRHSALTLPLPRTMRTCVEATTFNRLHISFNIQISVHIMTTNETARALHEFKLSGMASCWEPLEETHQLDKLALRDGMQQMLLYECYTHLNNRIQRFVKNANFRLKATIEELETDTTRGISAASASVLATCNYIANAMTLIITGPTGTGKTYYACALDDRACRNEIKVLYITMNMFIENLKLVHLEEREGNFFRKLNAHDLLIIDDFGMVRLEGQLQHDFEQIIDDRYNRKATILISQLPTSDWHNVFQSELIAEAFLDRIVHKALKFSLSGESLRKKVLTLPTILKITNGLNGYHRNW